jgi:hypothetical protein
MKYGQKVEATKQSLQDSFPADRWTDYKKLKKSLKAGVEEEDFFELWERELGEVF